MSVVKIMNTVVEFLISVTRLTVIASFIQGTDICKRTRVFSNGNYNFHSWQGRKPCICLKLQVLSHHGGLASFPHPNKQSRAGRNNLEKTNVNNS